MFDLRIAVNDHGAFIIASSKENVLWHGEIMFIFTSMSALCVSVKGEAALSAADKSSNDHAAPVIVAASAKGTVSWQTCLDTGTEVWARASVCQTRFRIMLQALHCPLSYRLRSLRSPARQRPIAQPRQNPMTQSPQYPLAQPRQNPMAQGHLCPRAQALSPLVI